MTSRRNRRERALAAPKDAGETHASADAGEGSRTVDGQSRREVFGV